MDAVNDISNKHENCNVNIFEFWDPQIQLNVINIRVLKYALLTILRSILLKIFLKSTFKIYPDVHNRV
jgi:hypothetical protein